MSEFAVGREDISFTSFSDKNGIFLIAQSSVSHVLLNSTEVLGFRRILWFRTGRRAGLCENGNERQFL